MEKVLEFKILKNVNNIITADLYVNGEYVVRLSDNIKHILSTQNSDVVLYNYFRKAVLQYFNTDCSIDGSIH